MKRSSNLQELQENDESKKESLRYLAFHGDWHVACGKAVAHVDIHFVEVQEQVAKLKMITSKSNKKNFPSGNNWLWKKQ